MYVGGYDPYLSRTPSNTSSIGSSIATSSDEEATTTDQDSAPSSTSESEAENGRSKPHGFKKQDLGARRISLGPKIEAAVSKLEKTPTKAPRPSRSGTPNASPGSLRAGVQRSLQQQQHKDYSSNDLVQPNFELQEDLTFWNDHNVQVGAGGILLTSLPFKFLAFHSSTKSFTIVFVFIIVAHMCLWKFGTVFLPEKAYWHHNLWHMPEFVPWAFFISGL